MLLPELKALWGQLANPKFLPFLLEPLLLWGVLAGTFAWMISVWWLKDRRAQLCSLLLLAVSAFSIYPIMKGRRQAGPAFTGNIALQNAQDIRREDTQWAYYTLGGLAVAGFFLTGEGRGKVGTALSLILVTGGLTTTVLSLWLQEREVAVFHPEARRPRVGWHGRSAQPAPEHPRFLPGRPY